MDNYKEIPSGHIGMSDNRSKYENKRFLVFGSGLSGIAAVELLT